MRFVRWKRRPGVGPGHEEIIVYEHEDGALVPVVGTKRHEIQCATVERVPFAILERNLLAHYERPE